MANLAEARVTVAEAAFLSGVAAKEINREIDAKVIAASGSERTLRGPDLVYLIAIKDLKNQMAPNLRKHLRKAITNAIASDEPVARLFSLNVPVAELHEAVLGNYQELDQLIRTHIDERADILGGEPVVRGTRIAARHVADLVQRGSSVDELVEDLELTAPQIRASVAFARTHPQRGRPAAKRDRTVHVSPTR